MRISFMDESCQSGKTEFVGLAAVHANAAHWGEFDERWNATLRRHSAPYLHMREFAHFVGPFRGWTEEQRRSLLADCLGCLTGVPLVMTTSVMSSEDFAKLPPERQKHLDDPYLVCFQDCLQGAAFTGYVEPLGEKVRTVYSQTDEFRGRLAKMFRICQGAMTDGNELSEVEFGPMEERPGLQLADLLVYEIVKYHVAKSQDQDSKLRFPFQRLCDHQRTMFGAVGFKYVPYWKLDLASQDDPAVWANAQEMMWADLDRWGERLAEMSSLPKSRAELDLVLRAMRSGLIDRLRARRIEVPEVLAWLAPDRSDH